MAPKPVKAKSTHTALMAPKPAAAAGPSVSAGPAPTPWSMGGMVSGGSAGGFTNTAELDPTLMGHLDRLNRRLDDPEGSTGRAIDRAGSKIRDAAEGTLGVMRNTLSKRGSLAGTSAGDLLTRDILTQSQGDIADAAADISLNRERDNDAFLMGSTGAFALPGQNARADRAQAFNEYMGHNQLQQANNQMALAARAQEMDQILRTFSLVQQFL